MTTANAPRTASSSVLSLGSLVRAGHRGQPVPGSMPAGSRAIRMPRMTDTRHALCTKRAEAPWTTPPRSWSFTLLLSVYYSRRFRLLRKVSMSRESGMTYPVVSTAR
jgi:hypothetical protein